MSTRFNRKNFLNKVNNSGVEEYDLIMSNWEFFKIKRSTTFYTIQPSDIGRPDILSLKIYNSIDYWWILLLINGINDPYNDLKVGDIIQIPSILDIEDFYLKIKNL